MFLQELANPGKIKFLDEVESIEAEAKRLKGIIFPLLFLSISVVSISLHINYQV
jgi:hypothetical protein